MAGRLTVVVLGTMGELPFGGHVWVFLDWLLGFSRLGHDVWYVEDDLAWPYDPDRNTVTEDCSYALRQIDAWTRGVGLADRWAYRLAGRDEACWGLSPQRLNELYGGCDLLLNLGGGTVLREEHLLAPCRVFLQTDPVIAEIELATGTGPRDPFQGHHAVATTGENFGAPDCGVPLGGRTYLKTRQAIDLASWPVAFDPAARSFTTVGNYRQEGSDRRFADETYFWSKHVEWEKVMDLPRRTTQPFQLAMMPQEPDRSRLEGHGWRLIDPFPMSLDVLGAYPSYIRASRAEFTVAKDMNVRLRSGWFSDRDACYLASGKPVVAQDTGFSNVLPTGRGLFAFTDADSALAAIEAINADYSAQCRAAREVAEEFFDGAKVAGRLLSDLGLS